MGLLENKIASNELPCVFDRVVAQPLCLAIAILRNIQQPYQNHCFLKPQDNANNDGDDGDKTIKGL